MTIEQDVLDMRIRCLEELLADEAADHPHFDMDQWLDLVDGWESYMLDDGTVSWCGTSACLAGTAFLLADRPTIHTDRYDLIEVDVGDELNVPWNDVIPERGAELLGLPCPGEGRHVFMATWMTRDQMIEFLIWLIHEHRGDEVLPWEYGDWLAVADER